ncbi:hypothetical protein QQ045_002125 [Rhodiola kirilowii]
MPKSVSQELEKIQRSFLWGGSESRCKMHYVKWATVKKPKRFGGLGIQDMIEKNLALLAKWWWKMASGKGGLWREMIIEKYDFKRIHHPATMSCRSRELSSTWRDIIKSVQGESEIAAAFREGIKLKLGRGEETMFWEDCWIGEESLRDQHPRLYMLAVNKKGKVEEMGYWANGVWQWQVIFRRPLYQWEEESRGILMEELSQIHLKRNEEDKVAWTHSSDGSFSINSLMTAAMKIREKRNKWEPIPIQLWNGLSPPKVELLIWKIYSDSLPSKMMLYGRKILKRDQNLKCDLCGIEQETTDHLLIHCQWSWKLWANSLTWWGGVWVMSETTRCLLESWHVGGETRAYNRMWKTLCYAVLWSIWDERNKRCFKEKRRSVGEIGELVKARVAWWSKYKSSKFPYSMGTIKRCIIEVRENS